MLMVELEFGELMGESYTGAMSMCCWHVVDIEKRECGALRIAMYRILARVRIGVLVGGRSSFGVGYCLANI